MCVAKKKLKKYKNLDLVTKELPPGARGHDTEIVYGYTFLLHGDPNTNFFGERERDPSQRPQTEQKKSKSRRANMSKRA